MRGAGAGSTRRCARAAVITVLVGLTLAACARSVTGPPVVTGTVETPRTHRGRAPMTVEYSRGLTESLFLPRGRRTAPLVLMVPGGSWLTANPVGLADLATYLSDTGVVAVPARVRVDHDGAHYPVPVEDVLCALAAAASSARSHGVEPHPLIVLGHSAGAQLAALAVLDPGAYSPPCHSPLVTPDALIGLAGPYDVDRVPHLARALFGTTRTQDPATWAAGNPVLETARRPSVPVLLVHGREDTVIPESFSLEFAQRLRRGGHQVTTDLVPGGSHENVFSAAVAGPIIVRWLAQLPRS